MLVVSKLSSFRVSLELLTFKIFIRASFTRMLFTNGKLNFELKAQSDNVSVVNSLLTLKDYLIFLVCMTLEKAIELFSTRWTNENKIY